MAKHKLKNAQGKTLTIGNSDSLGVDKSVIYLDTVDELLAADKTGLEVGSVAHVSDSNRGGTFTLTATNDTDGGVNFNGWKRDYSGYINSLWFNSDAFESLKLAIGYVSLSGGTVYLDKAVYKFSKQIEINSDFPVNLIGSMESSLRQDQTVILTNNYITPAVGLLPTDSLIVYSGNGGGDVRGLSFIDDNDITNSSQEARRVIDFTSAIRFNKWNLSSMKDCRFQYLNASAIYVEGSTMSNINNVFIRRCGALTKPALYIKDNTVFTQSMNISNARLEVNYGTYMSISSLAANNKISHIGFEADSSEVNTNNTFIENNGGTQFNQIHLNRNSALKVLDAGTDSLWTSIYSESGGDNGVISSSGANFELNGYIGKNNNMGVTEILSSGLDATLVGIKISGGCGIKCTANNSNIDATLVGVVNADNGLIEVAGQSQVKCNIRAQAVAAHCVYTSSGTNIISNSVIRDIPSGYSGIRTNSSQHIISSNNIIAPAGSTGIDTATGGTGLSNVHGNNTQGGGTMLNLHTSDITDGSNT